MGGDAGVCRGGNHRNAEQRFLRKSRSGTEEKVRPDHHGHSPVLGLSETAFLQKYSEGVVLVIRARKTERKDVMEAFKTLQKLGAHVYGFVLNRVDFSRRYNSYSYYYYSSNYYDTNWNEGSHWCLRQGMGLTNRRLDITAWQKSDKVLKPEVHLASRAEFSSAPIG